MIEFFNQPGFLGTAASFAADATLVLMLTVALLFTLGAGLAHLHQYTIHRWVQTTAAGLRVAGRANDRVVALNGMRPGKSFLLDRRPFHI